MEPSLIFAHEMDAHGDHMGVDAHNDFLFQHCLGGASYIHDPTEHDAEMQNIHYNIEYDIINTENTAHAQATTRQTYLDIQVQRYAQDAPSVSAKAASATAPFVSPRPSPSIIHGQAEGNRAHEQDRTVSFKSDSATPGALLLSTNDQQDATLMTTQSGLHEADTVVVDYSWDIYTSEPDSESTVDPALLTTAYRCVSGGRTSLLPEVETWASNLPTPLQSTDRNNRSPTATRESRGKKRDIQGRAAPGSDSEYRFGDDPAEEQPLSARSKPHPNCTFANINAEVAKAEDRGFTNVPTFVGSKLSVNTFDHAGLTHAGEDTSMLQPEPTTSLEAFGAIRTEISPHGQRTKTIAAEPPSQRPAKRDRLYGAKWRSSGGEACSIPIFDGFGDLRNSSDLLVQLDDIEFPALSSLLLQQKPKPKKVSLLGGTARHASPSATDWGIGPAALTDRPAKSAALTRVFRRTSGRSSMGSNTSASTNSTFDSVDLDGIERADAVHVPRPRASGAMRKPAVRSRGASAFPTPAPSSPGRSSVAPLPATKILPPPFDPDAFAPRRSTHAERSYNVAVKHLEERLNVSAYNCTARPEVDFVLPAWLAGKHGSRTSAEAKIKKILGAVGNQAMSKTNGVEKKGKATSRKKKDMAEDRMEVDEVWPALVPMKSGQTPKAIQCDTCESWYHLTCVGFKNNATIREDQEFKCPRCVASTEQPQRYLYCMRPDCQHGDVPLADDEYFVHRIVGRRPVRGGTDTEYLIEWAYDDDTTYPLSVCTWELGSGLDDPAGLIAAFESSAIVHNVDLKCISAPIVLSYPELQPFLDYNHVTPDS